MIWQDKYEKIGGSLDYLDEQLITRIPPIDDSVKKKISKLKNFDQIYGLIRSVDLPGFAANKTRDVSNGYKRRDYKTSGCHSPGERGLDPAVVASVYGGRSSRGCLPDRIGFGIGFPGCAGSDSGNRTSIQCESRRR